MRRTLFYSMMTSVEVLKTIYGLNRIEISHAALVCVIVPSTAILPSHSIVYIWHYSNKIGMDPNNYADGKSAESFCKSIGWRLSFVPALGRTTRLTEDDKRWFKNIFTSHLTAGHRRIAITFPFRHLTQVTPRRVVYGLIGLNLTMALTVKFQFISGMLLEVRCAFQMSDRQARQVYFFVLHCHPLYLYPLMPVDAQNTASVLFTIKITSISTGTAILFHRRKALEPFSLVASMNQKIKLFTRKYLPSV